MAIVDKKRCLLVLDFCHFIIRYCFGPPWRDKTGLNCRNEFLRIINLKIKSHAQTVWAGDFDIRISYLFLELKNNFASRIFKEE